MIWQDLVILAAQGIMLIALWPTLRDRSKWPHRATCLVTAGALATMDVALWSLGLYLSAGIVALLSVAWLFMGRAAVVDLVGTCPKGFWDEWVAEGDAAGELYTGEEWSWFTRDRKATLIVPGDRFYVVAWGRLRGYAPVTRLHNDGAGGYAICRCGDAVACTIDAPVSGFRGLRTRWWGRSLEKPFPDWKNAGTPFERVL